MRSARQAEPPNPATSNLTISGGQAAFVGSINATATPVGTTSLACGAGPCGTAAINGSLFGPQAAGVGITYSLGYQQHESSRGCRCLCQDQLTGKGGRCAAPTVYFYYAV